MKLAPCGCVRKRLGCSLFVAGLLASWLAGQCLAAPPAESESGASPAARGEKAAGAAPSYEVDPLDWPQWRGPEQNGISRETGLVDSWDPEGENLLWANEELAGRSTPIVMRGKLYTIVAAEPHTPRQGEKVVCADAATGDILWENRFNVFSSDVPLERVGWSCCVGDPTTGRVYAMGVGGFFQCLDGETGKTIWSRSLSEEFGLLSTYGGRTNTPVLFEDLVIISAVMTNWGKTDPKFTWQAFDEKTGGWGDMAKPAHRFLAMDKQTGEAVWLNGTRLLPDDTTYSTPFLTVVDGQAEMIFGGGDGAVYAMQPRTGNILWKYQLSARGMNVSPLVQDGIVYMSQSEENYDEPSMGAIAAIKASGSGDISQSGELWRLTEVMAGKSSPLLVDGRLYAVDDGAGLFIFDPATGEPIGGEERRSVRAIEKFGSIMRASLLYADGKIYANEANGRCHILEPTEDGIEVLHELRLPEGDECHGSPIVSHGRIYIPTTGNLYCIGLDGQEPSADPRPSPPEETPVSEEQTPAHLQVVPCDVLMRPGETVQFTARLFNARGQILSEATASYTAEPGGQIDGSGKFTADKGAGHQAALVTGSVEDVSGHARVRIVPPLPWKFDFSDGQVPITWVGARYRHIVMDHELNQSLTEQDPRAGQVYLYVMTTFSNAGRPSIKFEDKGLQQSWTGLLQFLGLAGKVRTLDQAKKALQPALDLLAKEKVIAKATWGEDQATGLSLALERGPRKVDEGGVMLKITTIPKGTRSQCWFGQPDLHDYTIQADVRAALKHNKLPDIGLIGQRYTLDLMGASQQLQLRSWVPEVARRATATVPFEWKADTWYTSKLRTGVEDGKAVLRGKVWERGQPEPEDWTVELVDDQPNEVGSPGLFGNANDSEIFIDNLTVTANK
jgi:outer membrane protein assembly factor BamB